MKDGHNIATRMGWYAAGAPILLPVLLSTNLAIAEPDGPDRFDVTGVDRGDTLNMHDQPNAKSRILFQIPFDAKGLESRGCKGGPTFREWRAMSSADRARSARSRWCRVAYDGRVGWVAGRFLREATAADTDSYGRWQVRCQTTVCVIKQIGIAARRPTTFRVEPRPDGNARIEVMRSGFAREGKLEIYMDGELITRGQVEALRRPSHAALVFEPDDVTAGLLRKMESHKNMIVSFRGGERGVEFDVENLAPALAAARRQSGTRP